LRCFPEFSFMILGRTGCPWQWAIRSVLYGPLPAALPPVNTNGCLCNTILSRPREEIGDVQYPRKTRSITFGTGDMCDMRSFQVRDKPSKAQRSPWKNSRPHLFQLALNFRVNLVGNDVHELHGTCPRVFAGRIRRRFPVLLAPSESPRKNTIESIRP